MGTVIPLTSDITKEAKMKPVDGVYTDIPTEGQDCWLIKAAMLTRRFTINTKLLSSL